MKILKVLIIMLIVFTTIVGIVLGILVINYRNSLQNNNESDNYIYLDKSITNETDINNVIEPKVEENFVEEEIEAYGGDPLPDYSEEKVQALNYRGSYYAIKDILNSQFNNQFIIYNIYILSKSPSIDLYWVDGVIKNSSNLENVIIITDSENNTWILLDKTVIQQNGCTIDNFGYIEVDKIEPNGENSFEYKVNYENTYVNDLLKDYFEKAMYCTEYTYYKILSEDCRKNIFPTLEEFEKYIKENSELLNSIQVNEYSTKQYDGYVEYTITDTEENNYVFKVTSIINYTVDLKK